MLICSNKSRGFSLIELLIVITIIGVLMMVAIPSYRQYVIKAKMVDLFVLIDAHKLKLLEKILGNTHSNAPLENSIINNPIKSVSQLEYIINHVTHEYILKATVNLNHLGIERPDLAPLIIEIIATTLIEQDVMNWQCQYTKGYANIMPNSCNELT